jgi:hypothetical protein
MPAAHAVRRVAARAAAIAAAGACVAAVAAPAASALNPQPLPPGGEHALTAKATTPLIGGFLTCHEYGCY